MIIKTQIEEHLPRERWEPFFDFVSRSYTMRRKTLATSLSWKTGNKGTYQHILETIGLDRKVRPEDLDVQKWLALYKQVEGLYS